MQIGGPKFKVSTVNTGGNASDKTMQADTVADPMSDGDIEDYFENSFGDPLSNNEPASKSKTDNANPLNDYTMNDIQDGAVVGDPNADVAEWLAGFPPSLNDIIAGNEKAISYLDMIRERYQKAWEDVSKLKVTYEQTIAAGGLTSNEIQLLNERIELANLALAKCEQEIANLDTLEKQMDGLHQKELSIGKDMNNDSWLGKPFTKGSYFIIHNTDGTITLIDAVTKKAIPCPFLDPTYKPQLTTDGSLEMIDIETIYNEGQNALNNFNSEVVLDEETGEYKYVGGTGGTAGKVDLFLRLTEEAFTAADGRRFDVASDIGIPQNLWVERSYEDSAEPYKIEYDDDLGFNRYSLYDNWSADGGIHQEVPTDLSKYVQINVNNAILKSEETGLTDPSGEKLYHHFLELYNDTTLIARIRIEGYVGTGPLAANTAEGVSYIAASTASFAINGDQRVSPIEFDASGMRSTGRHVMSEDKLEEIVGPPPASEIGQMAYNETFGGFTSTNLTTWSYNGTGWEAVEHDFSDGYGAYKDRYMPPDLMPAESDSVFGFRTGIFIEGLRGSITGTSYNDVIHTIGVNEKSPYVNDKMPEDIQPILKGDAYYSNIVNSQGGNDVVVAGQGDNYIIGATLVKVNAGSKDDNYIATPSIKNLGGQLPKDQKKSRNPKVYVNVEGGSETQVALPESEFDYSDVDQEKASTEGGNAFDKMDDSYVDDYLDIDSGSVKVFGQLFEGESSVSAALLDSEGMDKAGIETAAGEAYDLLMDELSGVPDVDESQVEAAWDEVMTQKTSLDDEMNGFFTEMFGDMESFFNESDEGNMEGEMPL